MENTLVDIKNNTTVPVRLLNLTNTEQLVHQDAVVSVADEFKHDVQLSAGAVSRLFFADQRCH